MICQNCSNEIKTTGFRLSIILKCKSCGARYQPVRAAKKPNVTSTHTALWFLLIFGYLIFYWFKEEYLPGLNHWPFLILWAIATFFILKRFDPKYYTDYVLVDKRDYPLKKQDALVPIAVIAIALLCLITVLNLR